MVSVSGLFAINPYVGSVILTFALCIFVWHLWNRKPANSPPGSRGIPLLGEILSMGAFPEKQMTKWGKKYGPLYMVKMGTKDVVVIGSPEIAYEAFAKNDCFNDRPQSIPLLQGTTGIVMINYTDFHKEQRRFGLNTLREFGMGRRNLEPRLLEICDELCSKLDDLCGKKDVSEPFEIHPMLYDLASRVISCMIFGHDVKQDNKELHDMISRLMGQSQAAFVAGLLMMAPFLKYFPVFSTAWKRGKEAQANLSRGIGKEVNDHRKSRDSNNPRDFIDCFLNEMEKAERNKSGKTQNENTRLEAVAASYDDDDETTDFSSEWEPLSSFYEEQLIAVVRDLFVAGTDTSSSTLSWIILYLCKYPDVQKKMQQEIDDVLGQSGVPRMSIMEKLPYVRAVIQEVSRLRPLVPLSVPHLASRDASLLGYRIPKGAIILTNIWAIHHDETRWPEPERFSPERHLDEDGKFIKSSHWMIFNVGGRNCLGQQLAKMELFITTVSLFRRFDFSLPSGYIPDLDGKSTVALRPTHFPMVATRR